MNTQALTLVAAVAQKLGVDSQTLWNMALWHGHLELWKRIIIMLLTIALAIWSGKAAVRIGDEMETLDLSSKQYESKERSINGAIVVAIFGVAITLGLFYNLETPTTFALQWILSLVK